VDDGGGKLFVFLDKLAGIDGAIRRQKSIKILHRDRIGPEFISAYEESKRMLIFCASTKVRALLDCCFIA
jgi:predicted nuclease with RNAse H fold